MPGTTIMWTATKTAAGLAGSGFIDGELTTIVFLAIQGVDGGLCLGIIFHFNKTEALATLGFTVHNDACACDFAECGKKRIKLIIFDRVAQVSNIQILAHLISLRKALSPFLFFPDFFVERGYETPLRFGQSLHLKRVKNSHLTHVKRALYKPFPKMRRYNLNGYK